MFNSLRGPFKFLIDLVARPFTILHPDLVSFGTILFAVPGFYFLSQGDSLLGSLWMVGAIFDVVDGAVARLQGMEGRKFGGLLDATIDRVFEGILLLSIGVGGFVSWEILISLLTLSVSVSYIKAKAEAVSGTSKVGQNQFSVGLMERGERLAIIFAACILDALFTKEFHEILTYSLLIVTLGSLITLIWRGLAIRKILG